MKRFVVLIIGLIFLGVGIYMYFENQRLVRVCTVERVATVVEMEKEESTDSDGYSSTIYYPVIEYEVNNDTQYARMRTGSSNPEYKIGDKVTILYNPDQSNEILVKGEKTLDIFTIIFLVAGLGITIYGIKVAISN